jgi:hypothetical protein
LLHRHGVSWAEIGERVGQQSKLVTADTYTHALIDSSEVNRTKLLTRVRGVQTPVQTLQPKLPISRDVRGQVRPLHVPGTGGARHQFSPRDIETLTLPV